MFTDGGDWSRAVSPDPRDVQSSSATIAPQSYHLGCDVKKGFPIPGALIPPGRCWRNDAASPFALLSLSLSSCVRFSLRARYCNVTGTGRKKGAVCSCWCLARGAAPVEWPPGGIDPQRDRRPVPGLRGLGFIHQRGIKRPLSRVALITGIRSLLPYGRLPLISF